MFQIQKMRLGGNDACIQFLQKYGVPKNMPIAQKYNTPAAALYRDRLDAQANGRPLPTELPAAQGSAKGGMSGAGSTHSSAGSLSSSRYITVPSQKWRG
jgi:ADP-ribosylation factor GTPase-activating protein 1